MGFLTSMKRARLLAAILLTSIAWGADAELTHSHGLLAQSLRAQTTPELKSKSLWRLLSSAAW
jgi:hypothetical protein